MPLMENAIELFHPAEMNMNNVDDSDSDDDAPPPPPPPHFKLLQKECGMKIIDYLDPDSRKFVSMTSRFLRDWCDAAYKVSPTKARIKVGKENEPPLGSQKAGKLDATNGEFQFEGSGGCQSNRGDHAKANYSFGSGANSPPNVGLTKTTEILPHNGEVEKNFEKKPKSRAGTGNSNANITDNSPEGSRDVLKYEGLQIENETAQGGSRMRSKTNSETKVANRSCRLVLGGRSQLQEYDSKNSRSQAKASCNQNMTASTSAFSPVSVINGNSIQSKGNYINQSTMNGGILFSSECRNHPRDDADVSTSRFLSPWLKSRSELSDNATRDSSSRGLDHAVKPEPGTSSAGKNCVTDEEIPFDMIQQPSQLRNTANTRKSADLIDSSQTDASAHILVGYSPDRLDNELAQRRGYKDYRSSQWNDSEHKYSPRRINRNQRDRLDIETKGTSQPELARHLSIRRSSYHTRTERESTSISSPRLERDRKKLSPRSPLRNNLDAKPRIHRTLSGGRLLDQANNVATQAPLSNQVDRIKSDDAQFHHNYNRGDLTPSRNKLKNPKLDAGIYSDESNSVADTTGEITPNRNAIPQTNTKDEIMSSRKVSPIFDMRGERIYPRKENAVFDTEDEIMPSRKLTPIFDTEDKDMPSRKECQIVHTEDEIMPPRKRTSYHDDLVTLKDCTLKPISLKAQNECLIPSKGAANKSLTQQEHKTKLAGGDLSDTLEFSPESRRMPSAASPSRQNLFSPPNKFDELDSKIERKNMKLLYKIRATEVLRFQDVPVPAKKADRLDSNTERKNMKLLNKISKHEIIDMVLRSELKSQTGALNSPQKADNTREQTGKIQESSRYQDKSDESAPEGGNSFLHADVPSSLESKFILPAAFENEAIEEKDEEAERKQAAVMKQLSDAALLDTAKSISGLMQEMIGTARGVARSVFSGNGKNQIDDQGPIKIGDRYYSQNEALQKWKRVKEKLGDVSRDANLDPDDLADAAFVEALEVVVQEDNALSVISAQGNVSDSATLPKRANNTFDPSELTIVNPDPPTPEMPSGSKTDIDTTGKAEAHDELILRLATCESIQSEETESQSDLSLSSTNDESTIVAHNVKNITGEINNEEKTVGSNGSPKESYSNSEEDCDQKIDPPDLIGKKDDASSSNSEALQTKQPMIDERHSDPLKIDNLADEPVCADHSEGSSSDISDEEAKIFVDAAHDQQFKDSILSDVYGIEVAPMRGIKFQFENETGLEKREEVAPLNQEDNQLLEPQAGREDCLKPETFATAQMPRELAPRDVSQKAVSEQETRSEGVNEARQKPIQQKKKSKMMLNFKKALSLATQ